MDPVHGCRLRGAAPRNGHLRQRRRCLARRSRAPGWPAHERNAGQRQLLSRPRRQRRARAHPDAGRRQRFSRPPHRPQPQRLDKAVWRGPGGYRPQGLPQRSTRRSRRGRTARVSRPLAGCAGLLGAARPGRADPAGLGGNGRRDCHRRHPPAEARHVIANGARGPQCLESRTSPSQCCRGAARPLPAAAEPRHCR